MGSLGDHAKGKQPMLDRIKKYNEEFNAAVAKYNKSPRTEKKLKQQVKELLNEHGAWYFMPVPTGMQRATVDFIGCYKGHMFAIETKSPGAKPTPRQEEELLKIGNAGGLTVWGDNIDHIRTYFTLWASTLQ